MDTKNQTEMVSLNAISPIDGRYHKATQKLADYFSEAALIKYRIIIEVEYFIALCEIPLPQLKDFDIKNFETLRNIYRNLKIEDVQSVKEIESITNHDVKAIEYFLKKEFDQLNLQKYKEFIHFGLTSQDINNTAVPLSLKHAFIDVLEPLMTEVLNKLKEFAKLWIEIPMLAHTHGQPASPTRLGKEIYVFAERVEKQMDLIKPIPFSAKFGGATGNFNAHHVAYPSINWIKFAENFVNKTLGLHRSLTTTQIEHYDNLASFCDNLKRINTILIDLNRDMWTYISMEYFKQKIKKDEVGSSAMPHKVNPIDFENSEGNLGVANALFEHLSQKLPVSRLQRDLTDSTVLRNIGVPIAHTVIALKSLLKGLNKLVLNEEQILKDLDDNWIIISEAIQTILRREGFENPYEILKDLTRSHKKIDQKTMQDFIDKLDVSESIKNELKNITPQNYTGITPSF